MEEARLTLLTLLTPARWAGVNFPKAINLAHCSLSYTYTADATKLHWQLRLWSETCDNQNA